MRKAVLNLLKVSRRMVFSNSLLFEANNLSNTFRHKPNPSFQDSFQFWIINKFRNDEKFSTLKLNQCLIKECGVFENVSNRDLLSLWIEKRTDREMNEKIESELIKRLKSCSLDDIFVILDASLMFYGHKLNSSLLFKLFMSRFELFTDANMTAFQRLQGLYYCSYTKKSSMSEKVMSKHLDRLSVDLHQLDNTELSILCLSLYRCSVKPNGQLTCLIIDRLKDNLTWFIDNPSLLTCIIKTLRHSKTYDDHLFSLVVDKYEAARTMDLISKIHLLVYFSDALYPDIDFMNRLIRDLTIEINSTYFNGKHRIRFKELDNFLWSSSNYWNSYLNNIFTDNNLSLIVNEIIAKQKVDLREIFNILLYLWTLNIKDTTLLKFITKNNILSIKNNNYFKDISKLSTLLSCISIEAPTLLSQDILQLRETRLQPKFNKYISKRPKLGLILNEIVQNKRELGLNDVKFNFEIPCLFIGNISMIVGGETVSIELCDDSTSYRNSYEPNGYMRLKLRLMNKLNINYYLIQEDFDENSVKVVIKKIEEWLRKS